MLKKKLLHHLSKLYSIPNGRANTMVLNYAKESPISSLTLVTRILSGCIFCKACLITSVPKQI